MSDQTPEQNEVGVIAYIFSNDHDAVGRLLPLLRMFYNGVYENSVGIMEVMDKRTGKPALVLVGITHEDDGTTTTVPIAQVLNEAAVDFFELPDGEGGWMDPTDQWTEVNGTKY